MGAKKHEPNLNGKKRRRRMTRWGSFRNQPSLGERREPHPRKQYNCKSMPVARGSSKSLFAAWICGGCGCGCGTKGEQNR